MSLGKTGMTRPRPITLISTEIRMKGIEALFDMTAPL
jgi:hypothetical protein